MIFLRVSIDTPGLFHALARSLPEGHQPRTVFGRKRRRLLGLTESLELDLQIAQLHQLLVPAPLQFAGDQTIVGINGIVLTMRPGGFVLGLLDGILDLLALVGLLLTLRLHRGQRRLDPERLQPIENLLGDDAINPHPAEADAVIGCFGAERTTAGISLRIAAFPVYWICRRRPHRAQRNSPGNNASPRLMEPRPI